VQTLLRPQRSAEASQGENERGKLGGVEETHSQIVVFLLCCHKSSRNQQSFKFPPQMFQFLITNSSSAWQMHHEMPINFDLDSKTLTTAETFDA
jgi:hypothetical protein